MEEVIVMMGVVQKDTSSADDARCLILDACQGSCEAAAQHLTQVSSPHEQQYPHVGLPNPTSYQHVR